MFNKYLGKNWISKNLIESPKTINGKTKENITRSGTTVPDPVHIPDTVICPDWWKFAGSIRRENLN